MRKTALAAVALALVAIAPSLAFAQNADTVPVGRNIFEIVEPYLMTIVSIAATAAIGWVTALLSRKFGLDIEARHREALQTALTNAAGLVLQRLGKVADGVTVDIHNQQVREGIEYVFRAVPDAARRFKLDAVSVGEKILAKLPQMLPPQPPAA